MSKIDLALEQKTGIVLSQPEVLDIVEATTVTEVVAKTKEFKDELRGNLEDDYSFARGNLRTMLERGMSAIEGAISLAKDSESPRVYEATSAFLKTLAEINTSLIDLSEKASKQTGGTLKSAEGQPSTINNNSIFIGSSDELATIIQNRIKGL